MNNKFAIWILTIMVIVTGLYAGLNMKQETMPDITVPNISIMTVYPGAAPDEIVEEITEPIEQRVQNLEGVEVVSSSSLANVSSVQLEFNFDKDMDVATDEVKEALSNLPLPEDAEEPEVSRISINAFPVIALSISNGNNGLAELTNIIEADVVPILEGIDGVFDVQVTGQHLEKVSMTFNEEKLQEYGLTQDSIEKIIQGSDVSFPLGLKTFDKEETNLVIDGDIASVEDLKEIEIPALPETSQDIDMEQQSMLGEGEEQLGQDTRAEQIESPQQIPSGIPTIQLKEVADIEVIGEVESVSRTNGEDSIGIQIVKAVDANTVDVVNGVKDEAQKLEDELGLTVTSTFDQGEPIEESVNMMLSKALFGILFAVVIILLFLRSIKTTLISIVSIPLSLLIALLVLHQMNITLNILTLGALTVAVGRVIDDSIVVMENIYRRMSLSREKLRGKDLIHEATSQMFTPIFSSTIVTIAVFLPLGLVKGPVGELFMPFALAMVFALAASLLVAVTIVPMLAHTFFKKKLSTESSKDSNPIKEPSKSATVYKRILDWTLDHKLITFGGSVALLVLSLFLLPVIGVDFLPEEEQKMIMATYRPEPGETREDVEKVAMDTEEFLSERQGVTTYQYSLGGGSPLGALGGMMGMGGDNSALFFIEYDDRFENFSDETKEVIEILNDNAESGEWKSLDFSSMSSGLELFVYGNNLEDIEQASDQVLSVLEENKNLVNAESSLSEAYDQYTLVADQKKLSQHGLTAAQIGLNLSNDGEAPVLTTVKHDGKDVNVYIEVEEKEFKNIDDLTDIEIKTPLGTNVKISDVMKIEEGKSPDTIHHRNGKMYANITADIEDADAGTVSNEIEDKLDSLNLPNGTKVEFGGITEDMNEAFSQLGLAMVAAIAIVYFILVITFGGALAPLSILFSLPFTVIGSLVALWIANEPLSVSAMIGALMLIGIVITNAIVLIDRVIHQEKAGLSTREALLEAGSTRLRPILMTAFATMGALIPLAISAEGSGLISKGMGVTVIGGLASSTLLTLVIVPIVYEVLAKFRKKELE